MAPRLLWTGVTAAAMLFIVRGPALVTGAQGAVQRAVVVISDLHMGSGRDESGRWRPDEDFRWAGEFAEFLRTIDAQHRGTVDLVLNGDTFNLPADDTAAVASLDRALTAHSVELEALAGFAKHGTNRIVLIPGDRDAALHSRVVSDRVVRALRPTAGRVFVMSSDYWLSQDGRVHVEHGHGIRFRG